MNYRENIIRANYFDSKASEWCNRNQLAQKQKKIRALLAQYNLHPSGVIVDIGCGTGVIYPVLAEFSPLVISIDSSLEMLKKFCSLNHRRRVFPVQCFAEEISLRDGLADWVIFFSSFPHFSGKLKTLKEAYRILRLPGNLLIFHLSSRAKINRRHRLLPPPLCHDLLPSLSELTKMSLDIGFLPQITADNSKHYFFFARK